MDSRLRRYYNRELQHLREVALEFAQEFPKIAGRLGMDTTTSQEVADPYVERLLEGFAFLTARVSLKLDAEFPRFTQGLLETVYPHYLAPTPSMAIVQFRPDLTEGALAEGITIPRDRALRSTIGKGDVTACEYRTAHDVTLFNVEVVHAEYVTRALGSLHLGDLQGARAGLRLRLRSTAGVPFSGCKADALTFYLQGADETPMRLYEQLFAHAVRIVVQPPTNPPAWRESIAGPFPGPGAGGVIERVGFRNDQALLPFGTRCFHGYRLLHEYFTLPQRFLFARLTGLRKAFQRAAGTELDIVILFREANLELEAASAVGPANFQLNCTPAVNLFPKRTDRILVSDRFHEFQVIPDRNRPLDFEVYQVQSAVGYAEGSSDAREFRPFYAASDLEHEFGTLGGGGGAGRAYFAVQRVPRVLSQKEKLLGKRSSYAGSEVYISLVDARAAPWKGDLRQLAVESRCTNRDLPLRMPVGRGRTDFTMEEGAPLESIRCITGPTAPRPSHAEGETAWRIISHLALNYLSLADSPDGAGSAALRDLLKLYGDLSDPTIRKQIDGLKTVVRRPIVRRIAAPGPVAFARGLEVSVGFEENAFEGMGIFLLGSVLDEFFARYVSLNSFTETVVRSTTRGEIMRWPARVGARELA